MDRGPSHYSYPYTHTATVTAYPTPTATPDPNYLIRILPGWTTRQLRPEEE